MYRGLLFSKVVLVGRIKSNWRLSMTAEKASISFNLIRGISMMPRTNISRSQVRIN